VPPQPQQYGAPQQQGAYGPPQQSQGLHQGPPPQQPPRAANRGGGGRGPNTKGLLIGAVAVVMAVVVGIVIAVSLGDKDKEADKGTTPTPEASSPASSSEGESGSSPSAEGELPPVTDAKAMKLDGGAVTSSAVKGAKAGGGIYVDGFNSVGAKVTWTVDGIADTGSYRLYVRYSIPGVDANATVAVNGKANTQPLGMKNFIGSPKGDWEKGWQSTWAPVTLTKGTNVLEVSCGQGNQCEAYLDQLWLEKS
ncbi:carbohydrate-binding protein, partial [Streptomyces niveiscabiei]